MADWIFKVTAQNMHRKYLSFEGEALRVPEAEELEFNITLGWSQVALEIWPLRHHTDGLAAHFAGAFGRPPDQKQIVGYPDQMESDAHEAPITSCVWRFGEKTEKEVLELVRKALALAEIQVT